MRLLGPIIEERRKCLDQFGEEWNDKPVRRFLYEQENLLPWLIERPLVVVDGRRRGSRVKVEHRALDEGSPRLQFCSYTGAREGKFCLMNTQRFRMWSRRPPMCVRVLAGT